MWEVRPIRDLCPSVALISANAVWDYFRLTNWESALPRPPNQARQHNESNVVVN